jgi:hypothetical protein
MVVKVNLEDRISQLEAEIAWLIEAENKAYDLGFSDGYDEADLNRFINVED